MSIPIKPTPVLYGKNARNFLKVVEENLKRDHSKSFERALKAFNKINKKYDIKDLFN